MERIHKILQDNPYVKSSTKFEDNLRLVYFFANLYSHGNEELCKDLFQEGSMELLRASKRYDSSKGNFSAYVGKCIRGSILTYLEENRAIHIPNGHFDSTISKGVFSFLNEYEKMPSKEELIEYLSKNGISCDRKKIKNTFSVLESKVVSLDIPKKGFRDDSKNLLDTLSDGFNFEDKLISSLDVIYFKKAIISKINSFSCSSKDKNLLKDYLIKKHPIKNLQLKYGEPKIQVEQIIRKRTRLLRHLLKQDKSFMKNYGDSIKGRKFD